MIFWTPMVYNYIVCFFSDPGIIPKNHKDYTPKKKEEIKENKNNDQQIEKINIQKDIEVKVIVSVERKDEKQLKEDININEEVADKNGGERKSFNEILI